MSTNRSHGYRVRLTADELADLSDRADSLGIPLSEAFRKGADMWLTQRESDLPGDRDELVAEVQALAYKIDRRLRGR